MLFTCLCVLRLYSSILTPVFIYSFDRVQIRSHIILLLRGKCLLTNAVIVNGSLYLNDWFMIHYRRVGFSGVCNVGKLPFIQETFRSSCVWRTFMKILDIHYR